MNTNQTEMLRKMTEYMNSPEGQASMKDHFNEIKKERDLSVAFYNSERGQEILCNFEKSDLESISDDDYHYNKDKVSFLFKDEKEFNLFFNGLVDANNHNQLYEEDESFSTSLIYVDKKFLVSIINGQGTITILEKLKNKVSDYQTIYLGEEEVSTSDFDKEDSNKSNRKISYGYVLIEFQDGTKKIYPFGNKNKTIEHLVFKGNTKQIHYKILK